VRQLEIKVLNIIDARCNHAVYVGGGFLHLLCVYSTACKVGFVI